MTQPYEYALLAAGSYDDLRTRLENKAPIPPGWEELSEYALSGSGINAIKDGSGFSAKVYRNTSGEVVISFAGTEFAATRGAVQDWINGNVALAYGSASQQALDAALLYERVASEVGGNITFTGHSLGGGLASLMAVWFDRPASVFAPAPFEAAATNRGWGSTLAFVLAKLEASKLGVDPRLQSYNPDSDFLLREVNVHAWAVQSEVIESSSPFKFIEAEDRVQLFGVATIEIDSIDRHSVDLHIAGLLNPTFNEWATKLPAALPRIFDNNLYGFNPTRQVPDFLITLIRNEVGVKDVLPNAQLTHFAADLQKLGTNVAALSRAAQDALVSQSIEWYYFQDPTYSGQEFFTQTDGLLQYTTAIGAALPGAQNKAAAYVNAWLTPIFNDAGEFGGNVAFDQWNVSTGGGTITANALDGSKTQIYVGNIGSDVFTGGGRNDLLLGGAGDDTLNGGSGNDALLGGEGFDSYVFGAEFGNDVVIDSDGAGRLLDTALGADGTPIVGGKRVPGLSNVWEDDTRQYVFTRIAKPDGSADLVIGKRIAPGASSVLGSVTVRQWQDGALGIVLSDEALPTVPVASTFDGGFLKKLKADGVTYELTSSGYVFDGADPTAQDLLYGTSDADRLSGGDGNDGLAGYEGDDNLDGGAGDDLILGGAGSDHIQGGAGNDFIFGSGYGSFVAPKKTTDPPPAATGDVLARGFGWVAFNPPGEDASGVDVISISNAGIQAVAGDGSNYIDAGAGDDSVSAGTGSDVVWAGAGRDTVYGMAGADVIFGEDGDDKLFGDGVVNAERAEYSSPEDHGSDVLVGGAGNDDLIGQGGDDQLYGGADDDRLFGDQLASSNGLVDDTPIAFHGNDFLDGGPGDDYLEGDGGDDVLLGGDGADLLWGDALPDRLDVLAHGNDRLDGGAGADTLIGGGGDDTLLGGDGDDLLAGDEDSSTPLDIEAHGDDHLDGGAGNDTLLGNGGNDTLHGGDDDDLLQGGRGNDALHGGNGADQLQGDEPSLAGALHGDDLLDGGEGNDVLTGGGGADMLYGGDGNDQLSGDDMSGLLDAAWHGDDLLDGGAGNDVMFGNGGDDTLYGGDGDDWLAGEDQTSASAVSALTGDDILYGGAGNDVLVGGNGSDSLDGGTGDDTLYGGDGNDTLSGGLGSDVLDGGNGDDTFVVASAETAIVDGVTTLVLDRVSSLAGRDRILLSGVAVADAVVVRDGTGAIRISGASGGVGIDNGLTSHVGDIRLDDGATTLRRLVNDRLMTSVTLAGSGTGGVVLGGALADTLSVTAGADGTEVSAGRGNDAVALHATGGATLQMARGDGTDTLTAAARVGAGAKNVLQLDAGVMPTDVRLVWGSNGSHVLSLGHGDGVAFQVTGWPDAAAVPAAQWPIDEIRFADGTVNTMADVVARGVYMLPAATQGDDVLTLTPVGDTFDGLAGDDTIDGADGNDVLYGGPGNDTLIGSNGDDTLNGGSGSDWLYGGAGNDTYVITSSSYGATASDSAVSDDSYAIGNWLAYGNYRYFVIDDAGGTDTLSTTGVTSDSIVVTNLGTDLMIRSGSAASRNGVWVYGAVGADGNIDPAHMLERMTFASGEVWDQAEIVARSLRTTAGDDQVLGYGADDVIDGGPGNDTIGGASGDDDLRGGSGYDWIDGGAGNDVLRAGPGGGSLTGGLGDDVFLVQSGDGPVTVRDLISGAGAPNGDDTLRVGAPRSAVSVSAQIKDRWTESTAPDTLELSWIDGSATIAIALAGSLSGHPAQGRIEFADGTVSSVGALMQPYLPLATADADELIGTSLDDDLAGLAGDDTLLGRAGDDTLSGGPGADFLVGGEGNDTLIGGPGDDTLMFGGGGDDTIRLGLGDGSDTLWAYANSGDDFGLKSLMFGAGIEPQDVDIRWVTWHDGSSSPDQLRATVGATGESLSWGRAQGDALASDYDESPLLIDRITFDNGAVWDLTEMLARANAATAGADILIGGFEVDSLSGDAGDDVLKGMAGDDLLLGGAGDDLLDGGSGDDTIVGGPGNDRIRSPAGNDVAVYALGDGDDYIERSWQPYDGALAPDTTNLAFGPGIGPSDLFGGKAVSALSLGYAYSAVLNVAGGGSVTFGDVDRQAYLPNSVTFFDGTAWTRDDLAAHVTAGSAGDDWIMGFRDTGDLLLGGPGNDILWGLAGSDTIDGGAGNDVLHAVGGQAGYYDGIWTSDDTDVLIGGTGDDSLFAGDGNVVYRFDPGFGHDRIEYSADWNPAKTGTILFGTGILSSDLAFSRDPDGLRVEVRASRDTIVIVDFEFRNPVASIQFADGTSISHAQIVARLDGSATDGPDLITGTDGADVIDALGGDDIVQAGAGADQVHGGAGNDDIDGGDGDDWLYGDSGNDDLRDGAGADHVFGGDGDDIIALGGGGDTVDGGAGNDTIFATADAETFVYGTAWGVDSIDGLVGGDTLRFDPSVPASSLQLWRDLGNGLRIEEVDGRSSISVRGFFDDLNATAGLTFAFADGSSWDLAAIQANVSGITGTDDADDITALTGGSRIRALAGNDVLTGSAGADVLDGGLGDDRMAGGAGNDIYVVDSLGDSTVEAARGGTDEVQSSITWTLDDNLERLVLTGVAAINGTGNSGNNTITGNSADNLLDGGAGNDRMIGGAGDDTYVVDSATDVVIEAAGAGYDTLLSSVTRTLPANVERLVLTGSALLDGTGNGLDNLLQGNAGDNSLFGANGSDTLVGGDGNDTLDGGNGIDTMAGGAGDDIYVVNMSKDVVTELDGEGVDTVRSFVSLTLGPHVENLTLMGSKAINGTGNALDNVMTGNDAANRLNGGSGDDTLDGGAGNDTLLGGPGNDTYWVDSADDIVTEKANQGVDTVFSAVTLTLSANVEHLTLTGSASVSGTGNNLDNRLLGNAGANTLTGGAGNDMLDGGAGVDTLAGGAGGDTYVFGRGWGVDTIVENDTASNAVDQVWFGKDIVPADVLYARNGDDLEMRIDASADKLVVKDWYLGSAYQIEQFRYDDGSIVTNAQVSNLISAMASFGSAPSAGDGSLTGPLPWDRAESALAAL